MTFLSKLPVFLSSSLQPTIIADGNSGRIISEQAVGITFQGIRELNEDAIGIFIGTNSVLIVVADGLGGNQDGDKASYIAVTTFCNYFKKLYNSNETAQTLEDMMQSAYQAAHVAVETEAVTLGSDLNTTLVAALISENNVVFANTGDSRAYLFSKGGDGKYEIQYASKDHSVVREMIDAGLISENDARSHPLRSVVTHTIRSNFIVDITSFTLQKYDIIMVMSDGVSGFLSDGEICELLEEKLEAEEICESVSEKVMSRSTDNVSIMVWKK